MKPELALKECQPGGGAMSECRGLEETLAHSRERSKKFGVAAEKGKGARK